MTDLVDFSVYSQTLILTAPAQIPKSASVGKRQGSEILNQTGRRRGRPATGTEAVHLRFSADVLDALDAYRSEYLSNVSRQEAVRKLVESHPELSAFLRLE